MLMLTDFPSWVEGLEVGVPKTPTTQPKWLIKDGDIPWSVWPFLRVTALLTSLTDT